MVNRTYTHEEVTRWAESAVGRAATRRNQEERAVEQAVREGIVRTESYDLDGAVQFLLDTYGTDFEITRDDVEATRPQDQNQLERYLGLLDTNDLTLNANVSRNNRLQQRYSKRRKWLAKKIVEECIYGPTKRIPKPKSEKSLRGLGEVAIDGVGSYKYGLWHYSVPTGAGNTCRERSDQYIDFTDEQKRAVFTLTFFPGLHLNDNVFPNFDWNRHALTLHNNEMWRSISEENNLRERISVYNYDTPYEALSLFERIIPSSNFRLKQIERSILDGNIDINCNYGLLHNRGIFRENIVKFLDSVLFYLIETDPNSIESKQAETILKGIVHIPDAVIELQKRRQNRLDEEHALLSSRICALERYRP